MQYESIAGMIDADRLDDAEYVLTAKVSANSRNAAALSLLGETYRRKGDKPKALKFLKRAMSINSSDPFTYLYIGKLYFMMQDFERACDSFGTFIKIVKMVGMVESDIGLFQKGLHDIANIYFSIKEYPKFREVLDVLLALDPNDQAAIYNSGIYYYWYERNRPKAYGYFKQAIDIAPDGAVAAKARYAIEFMRANPDPRVEPDISFIDQEFK